jgi:hypothetical protein
LAMIPECRINQYLTPLAAEQAENGMQPYITSSGERCKNDCVIHPVENVVMITSSGWRVQ